MSMDIIDAHIVYEYSSLSDGGSIGVVDNGFYGVIDDARVYDRALTDREIMAKFEGRPSNVMKW